MRRIVSAFAVALVACSVAYAAACSLQTGGGLVLPPGVDAAAEHDASHGDGADARASGCATPLVECNGACVSTCDGCDAGSALCTRTRVCGQCDKCPGYEVECFACADGGGPASAFCVSPSQNCGVPIADRCQCPFGEPMQCPGKNQVCLGTNMQQGFCFSCGENGTLNITCSNGLICVDSTMPPTCTGS